MGRGCFSLTTKFMRHFPNATRRLLAGVEIDGIFPTPGGVRIFGDSLQFRDVAGDERVPAYRAKFTGPLENPVYCNWIELPAETAPVGEPFITNREIVEIFGDEMPQAAVSLLDNSKGLSRNRLLLELRLMSQRWQPIETAPRDGMAVDLWCVQYALGHRGMRTHIAGRFRAIDCKWVSLPRTHAMEKGKRTPMMWIGVPLVDYHETVPTHWMVAPGEPQQDLGQ